ncbi:MAG: HAMP domain-containing sensor histidine kinase [Gammaproteobacteria bacterium]|nr:HAMP domain-containing sensor histidine kinase [Gammaproteobacteria bacterium]
MIDAITRSLSARLLAIFLLTSLAYGVASRYTVEFVLDRDYLREIVGAHMSRYTKYMLDDLGYPPSVERAQAIIQDNPYDIRIDGPGVTWSSDPDFPTAEEIPFEDSEFLERIRASADADSTWVDAINRLGFARHDRHSFVRVDEGEYIILFSAPKIAVRPGADLTWPLIGFISVLVLAGCYFAVRWTIRPIQWIKAGADRIGQGELDYRIPVTRKDELGELTKEINQMADDVQDMLEAKRQMLLAISHELRSPLTRTKVALEFLDDSESRRSIMEDIAEMERLIDDLLESERLNTRHSPLQRAEIDVGAMLENLLAEEFVDLPNRLKLGVENGPVHAAVDATRVRLLVRNLLTNALCYSPADGDPVQLVVRRVADSTEIRVTDHGSGMSPEQVARATEPFYRADPARCRDTGGLGLGLYLCRRIAEAHGGHLDIASRPGQGTVVTVVLPDNAEVG